MSAQKPSNVKLAEGSPFVLRVTYKNYGKRSKHLVKVGIKVSNLSSRTICAGFSISSSKHVGTYFGETLQLPANYIVNLHISNAETIIDADPPLAILPDEARTISISFLPSVVGGCTAMVSFEVTGILIFDDGDELYFSPPHNRITAEEVNSFTKRTPDEAELLAALNNRNIVVRRQAFSQLAKSTLDRESIKFLIFQGLGNEDPGIRAASAISAGKLGLKMFTNRITRLLAARLGEFDLQTKLLRERMDLQANILRQKFGRQGASGLLSSARTVEETKKVKDLWQSVELERYKLVAQETEIADYCRALGELRDPAGIDILVVTLDNVNFAYPEKPSDALIRMNHPEVIKRVRPLLSRNVGWLSSSNYGLNSRYREIIEIIVAYRDMTSVDILLNLAIKSAYIMESLVSQLSDGDDANRIIRDPFILALRPAIQKALSSRDSLFLVRLQALTLLARMPLDENTIAGYLRAALKDSDLNVRMNAADLAGDLGYKSLVRDILSALASRESEDEKQRYCTALAKLGNRCR